LYRRYVLDSWGVRGQAVYWYHSNWTPTNPCCHRNKIFTLPQRFGVCKTAEGDHHAGLCHAF